jgi:hypothetical protein
MALTQTTLTSAISASQITFGVTSTSTGFPVVGTQNAQPPQPVQIDGEFMYVTGVPVANTITVRCRGAEGTAAVAHDVLAPVITSSNPNDFGAIPPGDLVLIDQSIDNPVTIGQDGVIPQPNGPVVYNINKATAAALTLAAPAFTLNGTRVVITSQTAAAHVITATTLLADAVTGSPHTTATFAAFKGATITLFAENGLWHVTSAVGVVVT